MEKNNQIDNLIPSPELLEGEKVLDTFESSLWDIGIIGFLLRQKERIILTTHRVFQSSTNILASDLKCLNLKTVEVVRVGGKLNLARFLMGIILLLFIFAGGVFGYNGYGYGGYSGGFFGEVGSFFKIIIVIVGIILLLTARSRGLLVATGNDREGIIFLSLRRLKLEESKRFLDTISKAKEKLER